MRVDESFRQLASTIINSGQTGKTKNLNKFKVKDIWWYSTMAHESFRPNKSARSNVINYHAPHVWPGLNGSEFDERTAIVITWLLWLCTKGWNNEAKRLKRAKLLKRSKGNRRNKRKKTNSRQFSFQTSFGFEESSRLFLWRSKTDLCYDATMSRYFVIFYQVKISHEVNTNILKALSISLKKGKWN